MTYNKRENRSLLIHFGAVALLSLLLVLGYVLYGTYSKGAKFDKIFDGKTEIKQEIVTEPSINSFEKVYVGGTLAGYSYEVESKNSYKEDKVGNIKLRLITDRDHYLLSYKVQSFKYGTKDDKRALVNYLDDIVENNRYLGKVRNDLEKELLDVEIALVNLIVKVADFMEMEGATKYDKIFDVDTVVVEKEVTSDQILAHLEIYEDETLLGHEFTAEASGVYVGTDEGIVRLAVIVDSEGKILDYDILLYEHSPDGFKDNSIDYLDYLVENNVSLNAVTLNEEISGSTNSQKVIVQIFEKMSGYVEFEEVTKYDKIFGAKTTTVEKEVTGEEVLAHLEIYEGETLLGHEFTAEASGVYVGANEGLVKLALIVDVSGKILGWDILVYEHSGGKYKDVSIAYLNYLVEEEIIIGDAELHKIEINGTTTGNSQKVMLEIFEKISDYMEGK